MPFTYDRLLEQFATWAEDEPRIRGAAIIGSQARTDRPADRWSDLDLIVAVTDPQPFVESADWLPAIGQPWLTFLEPTVDGLIERRALFEGALDVDFVFMPVSRLDALESVAFDIVRRGVRIVLDKDGALGRTLRTVSHLPDPPPATPVDAGTFANTVSDFWYHTVWTAKKLRRGELWTASGCVDNYLKWQCVLPLLTWHTHAAHGGAIDTWVNGRFLEQWADPRALDGLRSAFGRYDAADLWRALFGTMALVRWLGPETAGLLGYDYPVEAVAQITAWVDVCYADWQGVK